MNYKRSNTKRRIWRKELNGKSSVQDWSRMLHWSRRQDMQDKIEFKKAPLSFIDN